MRGYCAPLRDAGVDTVILGCTHYPLVAPMLQRMLGPRRARSSPPGPASPAASSARWPRAGCSTRATGEGGYRFLCTGDVDAFRALGTRFLQMPLGEVAHVGPASRAAA